MIERTTVRLPSALLDRARKKAAAEGKTVTALIEEGLLLALGHKENGSPVNYPRVSRATGWLNPGINSIRDIEELEDIEYVERMNRGFKD